MNAITALQEYHPPATREELTMLLSDPEMEGAIDDRIYELCILTGEPVIADRQIAAQDFGDSLRKRDHVPTTVDVDEAVGVKDYVDLVAIIVRIVSGPDLSLLHQCRLDQGNCLGD